MTETSPDFRPAPRDQGPDVAAPTGLLEMERRLRLLDGVATWDDLDPEMHRRWDEPYGPAEEWGLLIENHEIPGPHGPVPARVYTPQAAADGPRPCLVWLHGGGFMHGDLDMPEGDQVARGVAGRADAVVVSVDYRLCDEIDGSPGRTFPGGPEHVTAPIPGDDVCAAVAWARDSANALGIDPARVAIGGASAGGNLAAAASLRLSDEGTPLAASLLMYPVAHSLRPEPDAEEARALEATPPMLRFSLETMRAMSGNYLGRPLEEATPYDFPGLAAPEQLAGLPRTYIETDEYDDLRVSGRRYAEQLREAGVDVDHTVRRGVSHGHLNRVGLAEAHQSMDRMGQLVREL